MNDVFRGDSRMRFKMRVIFLLCFVLVVGCSSDSNSQANDPKPNNNEPDNEESINEKEPVTLSIVVHWEEDMFNERFKDPIEKAYPWMTLEQVRIPEFRNELEEIFAEGISPDIFFEVSHEDLYYFHLDYDLDELIEKHQYDVSHIHPVYLESIRAKDREGRLLGMPYEVINYVLFYNKDIFDLFGQPYPSDLMTWDEALDLADKLTGEMNGVYYRGLDLDNVEAPLMQLSVNKTDPETGEVLLNQPEILQYFDIIDRIVDIQGREDGDPFDGGRFTSEQTTAMMVAFVQGLNWWQDTEGLNEAVAPMPVWDADNPLSHRPDGGLIHLSINPDSEHKDDAFRVLTHFTETEYQIWASRNGIGPTTVETEVLDQFFMDYESTHDKNVSSIFNHPPASPPEYISRWDSFVDFDLGRYVEEGYDRNEYLRIVTEESEAKIQEEMERE